jgi:hypothetical protein
VEGAQEVEWLEMSESAEGRAERLEEEQPEGSE